jgi:hypothetical protein
MLLLCFSQFFATVSALVVKVPEGGAPLGRRKVNTSLVAFAPLVVSRCVYLPVLFSLVCGEKRLFVSALLYSPSLSPALGRTVSPPGCLFSAMFAVLHGTLVSPCQDAFDVAGGRTIFLGRVFGYKSSVACLANPYLYTPSWSNRTVCFTGATLRAVQPPSACGRQFSATDYTVTDRASGSFFVPLLSFVLTPVLAIVPASCSVALPFSFFLRKFWVAHPCVVSAQGALAVIFAIHLAVRFHLVRVFTVPVRAAAFIRAILCALLSIKHRAAVQTIHLTSFLLNKNFRGQEGTHNDNSKDVNGSDRQYPYPP